MIHKKKDWKPPLALNIVIGISILLSVFMLGYFNIDGNKQEEEYELLLTRHHIIQGRVTNFSYMARSNFSYMSWLNPGAYGNVHASSIYFIKTEIEFRDSSGKKLKFYEQWLPRDKETFKKGDTIDLYYLADNKYIKVASPYDFHIKMLRANGIGMDIQENSNSLQLKAQTKL